MMELRVSRFAPHKRRRLGRAQRDPTIAPYRMLGLAPGISRTIAVARQALDPTGSMRATASGARNLCVRTRLGRMAEHAIHPPIHLVMHRDEPIRSLEAAAKVVRRHAGEHPDRNAQALPDRIEAAVTTEQTDAAGKAFRGWAQAHGLLLVPPENGAAS